MAILTLDMVSGALKWAKFTAKRFSEANKIKKQIKNKILHNSVDSMFFDSGLKGAKRQENRKAEQQSMKTHNQTTSLKNVWDFVYTNQYLR